MLLPLVFLILLCFCKIEKLKSEKYKKIWGPLFDDLRTSNKFEMSYNLIFILRVAVLVSTSFYL